MKIKNLALAKQTPNPFVPQLTVAKKPRVIKVKKEVYKLDVTDFVESGREVMKSLDHMNEKIERLDLTLADEKKKFLEGVKDRFDTKDQELALYKQSKLTSQDLIKVIKWVSVAQVSMAVVILLAILLK